jgi:CRISPR/Cas system-associated exonuclease Cas4 (RecB family)
LDYKTGKVEAKNLKYKTEDFEEIFTDPKYSQLFQLLCYAYLYQNNKENALLKTAEVQCGIIAFQELYKQNEEYIYYAEIGKERILTNEILRKFEEHLKQIFSSVLDKSTAFTQTEKEENCQYCDYENVCNK